MTCRRCRRESSATAGRLQVITNSPLLIMLLFASLIERQLCSNLVSPKNFSDWLTCVGLSADLDLMKEKFTKLLLGEDMSGTGKGVSSALALSNAITNLAGKHTFPHH